MRHLIFVGVLLISVTAGVRPVQACTCARLLSPAEALSNAAAVFAGEVIEIDAEPGTGGYTRFRVRFRVEASWKGEVGETVEVRTALHSAACGYPFEQGHAYLVYAHEHDGRLHTNICTRTRAFEDADADLELLGELIAFGKIPPDDANSGRCGGPSSMVAVQIVFFTLIGMAVLRRRV